MRIATFIHCKGIIHYRPHPPRTVAVSRAGAPISGIPPMTALIVRSQKLLGQYGTNWPLLFLDPGAAESPRPLSWSDMFGQSLVKPGIYPKGCSGVISSILSLITVFFCPSLDVVVVGSWLSRRRKSGGVLWFTEQERHCQTLLAGKKLWVHSLKRNADSIKKDWFMCFWP